MAVLDSTSYLKRHIDKQCVAYNVTLHSGKYLLESLPHSDLCMLFCVSSLRAEKMMIIMI